MEDALGEAAVVITCPECKTRYKYDEARFGETHTKKVKCTGCGHTFEVHNPAAEVGDETNVGREHPGTAPGPRPRVRPPSQVDIAELPKLAPLPKNLRFSLAVIAGSQAGSVFQITSPRAFLGRGTTMDIQLKDSEVSRRHAMLEVRNDQTTLIDLGATNGCYVDGERVDRAEIGNQTEFTLGSTTLMLIITQL